MMTKHVELAREIDRLPPKYAREVLDFVGYLQQKAQNEHDDGAASDKSDAVPPLAEIDEVRQLLYTEMIEKGTLAITANSGDGWVASVSERYAES